MKGERERGVGRGCKEEIIEYIIKTGMGEGVKMGYIKAERRRGSK